MNASSFADLLRQHRERSGLTQAELAAKLKTHPMTISKLETGRRIDPRWSTVCALADALGLDVGAFRGPAGKIPEKSR